MKKILLLLISLMIVVSCGSRKSTTTKPSSVPLRHLTSDFNGRNSNAVDKILSEAEDFLGTPYKLGGTSKTGLDCSGLVIVSFGNKVKLPRRSQDQAQQGKRIEVENIKPGDLLFFDTTNSGGVTHVGIVKEIRNQGEITFIHASTTHGVMISSLNDRYWNKAFLFARRVL